MVWLWVLLAFALTPVLGGTFWALATEGRRNHPKWGVFRSVQYAHRGLHNRELGVPENSMAAFRRARASSASATAKRPMPSSRSRRASSTVPAPPPSPVRTP